MVVKNSKRKPQLLLGVEDTGHVTIQHRLTNLSFLLFSSFFCPFVLYCFTLTVSSTPSGGQKHSVKITVIFKMVLWFQIAVLQECSNFFFHLEWSGISGSVHRITLDKLNFNAGLGLSTTLIRHENGAVFENTLQTRGI